MPKILVSYRREDSAAYAGRLADRLKEHFGSDSIFIDIDTIKPGQDFVEAIEESVSSCDALVAVIGKTWITGTDAAGRRRLDREGDFIRMEIATALGRKIQVIPTLVGGARMPDANELPESLAKLARRQALEISDERFHQDVDRLIGAIGAPSPPVPVEPTRTQASGGAAKAVSSYVPRWLYGATALVLVALAGYWWTASPARAPNATQPVDGVPGRASSPDAIPPVQSKSSPTSDTAAVAAASSPEAPVPAPGSSTTQSDAAAVTPAPQAPAGKTGIAIVWRGGSRQSCFLYDASGQKLLSPDGFSAWTCEAGSEVLWDAAPGKYVVKFGAIGVDPLPVTVTAGRINRLEPKVGQVRLHWNGTNRVAWWLWTRDGQKSLSPEGFSSWTCDAGSTSAADVAPGEYLLKIGAVGYQPVKVNVSASKISEITVP